jgi:hypothetical protein
MAEEREGPSEDPIVEAERVTSAATSAGVSLKLLGGAGVWLHSPSARFPPLKRKYGDLDFAVPSRQRKAVQNLFPALGYEPNERFNALQGDRRLFFWDTAYGRQVDIFLDTIKMCHVIDLRGRLETADPCVSPADLLLSKLQIYELNQKDVVDLVALFLDHSIADYDDDAIDGGHVARLAAEDWGLYRTLQLNTERLRAALPGRAQGSGQPASRRALDTHRRPAEIPPLARARAGRGSGALVRAPRGSPLALRAPVLTALGDRGRLPSSSGHAVESRWREEVSVPQGGSWTFPGQISKATA